MRLLIAAIGKLKQGPERDLFAHYLGRAEAAGRKLHLSPLTVIEVAEVQGRNRFSPHEGRSASPARQTIPSAHLTDLSRSAAATHRRSEALRRLLAKFRDGGALRVWPSLVGGADGLGNRRVGQGGEACAVARSDDLAARTRANRSCRANLPRGDHPCGPPLSSRLKPPPRLRIGKPFCLDSAVPLRCRCHRLNGQGAWRILID